MQNRNFNIAPTFTETPFYTRKQQRSRIKGLIRDAAEDVAAFICLASFIAMTAFALGFAGA